MTAVITSTGVGGAERLLEHLVTGLARERVEVEVLSLKAIGDTGRDIARAGIPVETLSIPDGAGGTWPTVAAIPVLARRLRRNPPDVVHSLLFRANVVSRVAAYRAGHLPVVAVLAGHQAGWKNALERSTQALVTRYVAVARALVPVYARRAGIPPARIDVIHPGVPPSEPVCATARAAARTCWGRSDRRVHRVLWFGRFVEEKGLVDLVEAFRRVAARDQRPQLLLQGLGPEIDGVRACIAHHGLTDRVRIREATDGVAALLAAADAVVLASHREGLPHVVLEALAAGRHVVATRVDGVPEIIEHGVTGCLVPPRDPHSLAEALLWSAEHPDECQARAEAGRLRVRDHFGVERMVSEYLSLYESTMRTARHRSVQA